MRKSRAGEWALACALLLALSCTSAKTLARRSEVALRSGDPDAAYLDARAALAKDGTNAQARDVMTSAAAARFERMKHQVRTLAAVDTFAGAEAALAIDPFRAELARFRIPLPDDPAYAADESRIRRAAARRQYREATLSLKAHHPKQAYRQFVRSRDFAPGDSDVEARVASTLALAITRVAILPFQNETRIPGLSAGLAERMQSQIARRLDPQAFTFTRLVDPGEIAAHMTVSQLDDLTRDEAIHLGRAVGARRVVWGRITGVRSNSDASHWTRSIYHPVTVKTEDGHTRREWVEVPFHAVSRMRELSVDITYEIVDTEDEQVLARRDDTPHVEVRTVYTNARVPGDASEYALVPPSDHAVERSHADDVHREWHQAIGAWTLPQLLAHAQRDRDRRHYRATYRSEFEDPDHPPVFLDDLPGEGELAFVAIADTWRSLYDALRDLDER